jgi:glutamyl-tRNA reductase
MVNRNDGYFFYVAGINYRKSDTAVRGQFSLNAEMIARVLAKAKDKKLSEVLVLSTCNRTEIYGLAPFAELLIELLCSETQGNMAAFLETAYIKKNKSAVDHLYHVAAGLDSQILGDYEIIGQLKTALKLSAAHETSGPFLNRLFSSALQASKEIKNSTALSGGTVSVSFAAVQMIRNIYADLSNKKILLLGTGKIGSNTCKNLVDYTNSQNVTLINRSREKATSLAVKYGLQTALLENLDKEIQHADIIVVATNASHPIITENQLSDSTEKLIIDLSVPLNVAEDVSGCPGVRLIRVDELSKMKDDTLSRRKAEIPKAKALIEVHMSNFKTWNDRRKHAPMLSHLKTTLHHLHEQSRFNHYNTCSQAARIRISKVLSDTARELNEHNRKGCQFISAINQFMN